MALETLWRKARVEAGRRVEDTVGVRLGDFLVLVLVANGRRRDDATADDRKEFLAVYDLGTMDTDVISTRGVMLQKVS